MNTYRWLIIFLMQTPIAVDAHEGHRVQKWFGTMHETIHLNNTLLVLVVIAVVLFLTAMAIKQAFFKAKQ